MFWFWQSPGSQTLWVIHILFSGQVHGGLLTPPFMAMSLLPKPWVRIFIHILNSIFFNLKKKISDVTSYIIFLKWQKKITLPEWCYWMLNVLFLWTILLQEELVGMETCFLMVTEQTQRLWAPHCSTMDTLVGLVTR